MIKLPLRLQTVFDLSTGPDLWDIGCDHGLLALYNCTERKFSHVYCVDRSPAAIEQLRGKFQSPSAEELVSIIHSDGCHIDWNQVQGTVSIAGVGTHTVLKIVESAPPEIRHRLTWVLAPQNYPGRFFDGLESLFPPEFARDQVQIQEGPRRRLVVRVRAQPTS